MNALYVTVIIAIATSHVALSQGPSKSVPADKLLRLPRGISQHKVEEVFCETARHQFTAQIGERVIRCVSFAFESKGSYYFVFTNEELTKICEPPRPEYRRVPYRGTWREFPDHSQPDKVLKRVLDSPDLEGAELSKSLNRRGSPTSDSLNVLPAFVLAAPVAAAVVPFRAEQRAEIAALREKFDPNKIMPGMSVEEVQDIFGTAHVVEPADEHQEIRYYGSARLGANPALWVSVAFNGGRAVRVFSNNFFNMEKMFPK